MGFKITLKGDKELIKKLTNTAIVRGELVDAATKSAVVIDKRLKTYPKQRPSSTYKRTGTLGRNWGFDVKPFATGVRAFHENPVSYMPDVQDPVEQAPVHQGRWPTTRDALREQQQKIIGFFKTAVTNIRRRLG